MTTDSTPAPSPTPVDPNTPLPPVSRVSRRVWVVVGVLAALLLWVAGFSSDRSRPGPQQDQPPRETQSLDSDPAAALERRLREQVEADRAAVDRRRRQELLAAQIAQRRAAAPALEIPPGAAGDARSREEAAFQPSYGPPPASPQPPAPAHPPRPAESPALRAYREAVEASPFETSRAPRGATRGAPSAAPSGMPALPDIANVLAALQPPSASSPAPSLPPPALPPAAGESRSPPTPQSVHLAPLPAPSPFTLPAGSVIPATLVNAVVTDLPGGVATALVRQDVYDGQGRHILIPMGSRLLGTYTARASYGDTRVLLSWTRLTLPNGTSFNLEGIPASDHLGAAGVFDRVDRHLVRLYGNALLLSVVSAATQLSQPGSTRDAFAVPSAGETAAAALGQQLGDVTAGLIERELNVRPTLILRPGTAFVVVSASDIIFPSGNRP